VRLTYAAGTPTGHIGCSKQSCVTARLSLGQLVLGVLEQPLHPEKQEHVKMSEVSTHHAVVLHAMASSEQYIQNSNICCMCTIAEIAIGH